MIFKTYHPIERGKPAVWIERIERGVTPMIMRYVREFPKGGPVEIVVHSTGGSCAEGLRLFTALRDCPRQKRVTILDARSMAAILAMAGDVIRIVSTGTIFLHPPGCRRELIADMVADAHVTSDELRRVADGLDETDELHLDILQRRSGLDRETLRSSAPRTRPSTRPEPSSSA